MKPVEVDLSYGRRLDIAPGVYLRVGRRTANIVAVAVKAPEKVSVKRGEDRGERRERS
jgi:sRNA-binding carbon storage regulator CsrA